MPPPPSIPVIQTPQPSWTSITESKTKGRARKRLTPNILSTTIATNQLTPVSTNLQEIQKSQIVILDYNGQQTTANLLPSNATVSQFINNGQQRTDENYFVSSSSSAPLFIVDAASTLSSNTGKKIQKRRNIISKNYPITSQIQSDIQETINASSTMDKMNDTIEQVVCQITKKQSQVISQYDTQKRKLPIKKQISKGNFNY